MQSETVNQSQNSEPSTPGRPKRGSVQGNMQDGSSIMEFVAKNSPGYLAPQSPAESEIQEDVNKMTEDHQVNEPAPTPAPEEEVLPDVTREEPLEEPTEEPSAPEEPTEEGEVSEDDLNLKGSTAENFKKLRVKVKELKEETTKKDSLLAEVTEELTKYASGEKVPEEIAKREARIAELEPYEKLLNLKKSKYYQETFIDPLDDIKGRLGEIAKIYEIDPGRLAQAANLQNEAELNRFLSNNFDSVGAEEVKTIVKEYQSLREGAALAEQAPVEALNTMIESAKEARAQQSVVKMEVMQDVSRDAWKKSLNYIKGEGKIHELIYREGDMEHNKKVFAPIVQAAATEYGKLVNHLAKNGLEELPPPLAYALSRLCQLAHASATAIDSRERAVVRADNIENNTIRTQKHIRPSLSGRTDSRSSSNGNGSGAGGGPGSTMEAAESILQQIKGR